MWILGSFRKEASVFYLPGLVSIVVACFFPNLGETSLLFGLLATAIIDSGHVYTTAWRTFFHPEERNSSKVYVIYPLAFFALFFSWFYFRVGGLWSFVVYSTLYHHVRQVYGYSKWYQALNRRQDKTSDFFLYALAILPMITYHFRPGAIAGYYSEMDLFLYPSLRMTQVFILLYSCLVAAWVIYERRLWQEGIKEANRVLSVALPGSIYGFCFLKGETITQVLFPLLFIHGISYCFVMGQTLHRTRKTIFSSPLKATALVILTACFFGLTESWMESNIISITTAPTVFSSVFVALWLTPLYCHYFFDAIIWRKKHRESTLVIGPLSPV